MWGVNWLNVLRDGVCGIGYGVLGAGCEVSVGCAGFEVGVGCAGCEVGVGCWVCGV